ncbi:MAG: transcriptional regulator [Candidatus Dormibacteraeota bacterium]|nr:transcriptional regulator [Candidatus Dormibacteraeota bacterium]
MRPPEQGDQTEQELAALFRVPLDPILGDAVRLRLVAALHGVPISGEMSFTALRRLLELTDGNLGVHLGVLSESGYVESTARASQGRRRQTFYRITPAGEDHYGA